MAASKPTSWLSKPSHIVSHLTGFRDLSWRSGLLPEGDRLKSWADVNRVLQDYAVLIRYRLCRFRGAADCVSPPDILR